MRLAFKDYSKGIENLLTSSLDGSAEIRSEKTISLYPGSDSPQGDLGGDKIVWIRDGAKLVFEGRYPDDYEAKLYADTLTDDREILLQDKSGTIALLSDLENIDLTYTNLTPMPESVGGLEIGSTFDSVSFEDMFTSILYPYQYPSFSIFTINGQNTILEVGDSVNSGDITFSWNITNDYNVQENSIVIYDVTGNSTLAGGLDNDGIEIINIASPIIKTSNVSNVWRIVATNSKSQTFERNYYVNWRWRTYYGTSSQTSLDEAGVKNLTSDQLENTFIGNKIFAPGDYKYMAYPTQFGQKSSFFDQATGFVVAMETPYTVTVTNDYGISTDYYVHRTTNTIVGAITIGVS